MSANTIMLILGLVMLVGSLLWAAWPMYRRHREFRAAVRQVEEGAAEHDDAKFTAGLERIRQLTTRPEDPDQS